MTTETEITATINTPIDAPTHGLYVIESNIPLPSTPRAQMSRYPWKGMNVNDSFFVAGKKTQQLGSIASAAKKKYGIDVVTKTVEENGVVGVRIWRTA